MIILYGMGVESKSWRNLFAEFTEKKWHSFRTLISIKDYFDEILKWRLWIIDAMQNLKPWMNNGKFFTKTEQKITFIFAMSHGSECPSRRLKRQITSVEYIWWMADSLSCDKFQMTWFFLFRVSFAIAKWHLRYEHALNMEHLILFLCKQKNIISFNINKYIFSSVGLWPSEVSDKTNSYL